MHLVISPSAASGRRPCPDMRRDGYGGFDFDGSLDAPDCFPRGGAFVACWLPDSDVTFDHGYTSYRGDLRDSIDSHQHACAPENVKADEVGLNVHPDSVCAPPSHKRFRPA